MENKLAKKTVGLLPSEVMEKENNGEDFVFVDVRNPKELKAVCLEKTVNIPLSDLAKRASELDKTKAIITSCGVGLRAAQGYRVLKHLGFENIRYMDGGLTIWPDPVKKEIPEK